MTNTVLRNMGLGIASTLGNHSSFRFKMNLINSFAILLLTESHLQMQLKFCIRSVIWLRELDALLLADYE